MSAPTTAEIAADLVKLGYLDQGRASAAANVTRAILRFQRHAARAYRMPQPDAAAGDRYKGPVDGNPNADTLAQIAKWKEKGWKVPVGRFRLAALADGGSGARLRQDAATAWNAVISRVKNAGGTVGVYKNGYGDTARPVRPNAKVGASRYSFHYCGRAVDLDQDFTLTKGRRYYVQKDAQGGDMFWRILCKTDKQDGSQGTLIRKGLKKYWDFGSSAESALPEAYYLDLTTEIESDNKFERIKAQSGWESSYNKSEWWHFQYALDKQPTFLDEMELIGYTEAQLRAAGWSTDAMLDHAPG